jgi:hypothetical protein
VPDEELRKMLSDNFLDPDNVVLEQNSPVVNNGDKLILFDTGMGTSKAFGPTTGRQHKSMAEAGIKLSDITSSPTNGLSETRVRIHIVTTMADNTSIPYFSATMIKRRRQIDRRFSRSLDLCAQTWLIVVIAFAVVNAITNGNFPVSA